MIAQVAVGSLDTPIGELWIACSEQGVCKVIFPGEGGRRGTRAMAGIAPSRTAS